MNPARIMTRRGYWRDVPANLERHKMTVCITASANSGNKEKERRAIIFCSDTRMSGPLGTAEMKRKDYMLTHGWLCLMSGNESDILALVPLLVGSFKGAAEIDETNVCQLVRNALNDRKREKIEELIQGRYGINYDLFLKIGKTNFPEGEFQNTTNDIRNILLGACCLIGGFADKAPLIIEKTEFAARQ